MATSGSKTVTIFSSWLWLDFEWQQKSQSVADNTTTIGWKMVLRSGNGALYKSGRTWTVTIDGTKKTGTVNVDLDANSTQTLASGTSVIKHNDNGSKTFSYSFSQQFGLTLNNGNYMGTYSGSGSATLTTIPRKSTLSVGNGTLGTAQTLTVTRESTSFTHTIKATCGSASTTVCTKSSSTSISFTPPLSWASQNTTGTSVSVKYTITTYNGSTSVGSNSYTKSCSIPSSVKPSCKMTLEDVTGIDDIYGSPVKGLSKIKITVTPTLAYSSPIASYSISANGAKYTKAEATTGVLLTSGSSKVTATVKDKRGRSGSASYTMTVQDYAAPSVTALAVRRCNSDGTANDRGEYVKVTFSATVSSMSSKNTAAYTLRYKKSADSDYTEVPLTALKNNYAVSDHTYIFAADGSSSYDVDVTVADRHKTATRSTSASTAFTLINYHPEGNAIRFGGVAEEENTFQNDLEFRQAGNHYAFQPEAFGGTKGYILLAVITLNTLNVNAPIVFQINRRGALCPMNVYVRFASSSTTTDPDLGSITYEGDNFGAFMVKAAESTWKLYVDNITGWSNPCLQDWFTTDNQMSRLSVEFPSEIVEGTDPSVLGTYYRATPAKMPSILDFVYPVGSIYLAYNHTSPATLFGGTWVRLENAFLWATPSSGTIGATGGEKTHTLTTNEMPSHTHKPSTATTPDSAYPNYTFQLITDLDSSYTGRHKVASGSDYYVNTATADDYNNVTAVAHTAATGGGAAHNNMPPYIQVSAWRRTA